MELIEEEKLKTDILFQIDMQLYDEFNDKLCEIHEHLGDIYTYKDLRDIEDAEKDKERTLLREAIKKLQKEIDDLKTITQNYNAIGGETFGDDRIIFCSMKYFDNGYFKKNYITKDKIKKKIKEFEQIRDIIAVEENHDLNYDLKRNDYCEKMLNQLLEEK